MRRITGINVIVNLRELPVLTLVFQRKFLGNNLDHERKINNLRTVVLNLLIFPTF